MNWRQERRREEEIKRKNELDIMEEKRGGKKNEL